MEKKLETPAKLSMPLNKLPYNFYRPTRSAKIGTAENV